MTLNTTPIQSFNQVQQNFAIHSCLCGCGTATKSKFAPGHDCRMKGQLLRAYRANGTETEEAAKIIIHLGWGRYIGSAEQVAPTSSMSVRIKITCDKTSDDPIIESDDVIRIATAPVDGSFLTHHNRWFEDAGYQARCRAQHAELMGGLI